MCGSKSQEEIVSRQCVSDDLQAICRPSLPTLICTNMRQSLNRTDVCHSAYTTLSFFKQLRILSVRFGHTLFLSCLCQLSMWLLIHVHPKSKQIKNECKIN